jgi:hypothetical protein
MLRTDDRTNGALALSDSDIACPPPAHDEKYNTSALELEFLPTISKTEDMVNGKSLEVIQSVSDISITLPRYYDTYPLDFKPPLPPSTAQIYPPPELAKQKICSADRDTIKWAFIMFFVSFAAGYYTYAAGSLPFLLCFRGKNAVSGIYFGSACSFVNMAVIILKMAFTPSHFQKGGPDPQIIVFGFLYVGFALSSFIASYYAYHEARLLDKTINEDL